MFTIEFFMKVILTALIIYFALNSYFRFQLIIRFPIAVGIVLLVLYIIANIDSTYTVSSYIVLGGLAILIFSLFVFEWKHQKHQLILLCYKKSYNKVKRFFDQESIESLDHFQYSFSSRIPFLLRIEGLSYHHSKKLINRLESTLQSEAKKIYWNHLAVFVFTVLFMIVLWRF